MVAVAGWKQQQGWLEPRAVAVLQALTALPEAQVSLPAQREAAAVVPEQLQPARVAQAWLAAVARPVRLQMAGVVPA